MGDRKLFYARDKNQSIVHVDKIKERTESFYCPFCKGEVIPKLGGKKIWHFAHKSNDKRCDFNEVVESQMIGNFVEDTIQNIENIEVPHDCENYLCPFCRNTGNKDFAVVWKSNIYICKNCFLDMNGEDAKRLVDNQSIDR